MQAFYETKRYNFTSNYSYNLNFPPHLHSQMECVYVLEGELNVSLNNIKYRLKQGDLLLVFPNIIHSYDSFDCKNKLINTIFDTSFTGSFIHKIGKYHPKTPVISSENVHKDVEYAMQSLCQEIKNNPDKTVLEACVQLMLARAFLLLEFEKNTSLDYDSLTYKIALYISENYKSALSLDKLASELCVCKYHISHILSKKMGVSFSDYVNHTRLKMATYLLDTTDKPIIEVWSDCGFESQRTFNRVFKKEFKMPPSQYRNNLIE